MKAILAFALLCTFTLSAKDPYQLNPALDVQHYVFQLSIAENHDTLKATASIKILLKDDVNTFSLDLRSISGGKGMQVKQLLLNRTPANFTHTSDKLQITGGGTTGEIIELLVVYKGVPADGLIIGKNKFGDKTFFGDNWPDRARHWLPVIDHPADKATCEFIVAAPVHYEVVANGRLKEESLRSDKIKVTHWVEAVPIPTKVMVMGAARFAVEHVGEVKDVPVQSWVFPQNREAGFYDYAPAAGILDTLQNLLGPYPFEKLANVQSKTRYGGMENAGNIFYYENSVTGQRKIEGLIAHEIAHQWFGNSASEKDWHHIWLSEGFATYLAQVYMERTYGSDSLQAAMKRMIPEIKEYHLEHPASPVVDTTITQLTRLLSANSYQKGAWVLHMLRKEVGDKVFFEGIRRYYAAYAYSNALTNDFKVIMEEASGQQLNTFFSRWLYEPLLPQIRLSWEFDSRRKKLVLLAQGNLKDDHTIPLEIAVLDESGAVKEVKTIQLSGKSTRAEWDIAKRPAGIAADPDVWLLADIQINNQ